jgi:hypothetical protein
LINGIPSDLKYFRHNDRSLQEVPALQHESR